MSKYILEIKPEYEDSFKGVMILGAKDSNLFVDTLAVENLEELTADYINEHFGSLQDDAYRRGLEDGKQTAVGAAELREKLEYQKGFKDGKAQAERGCDGCKYEWVEKDEEPCAHCAICYINHWTAKQTDDHIEVGDTVNAKYTGGNDGIVTKILDDKYYIMWSDGSWGIWHKENIVKTGKHFDIQKILEDMRND